MTIQELYIFACKNTLCNADIYEVIHKYNKNNTPVSISSSLELSTTVDDTLTETSPVSLFNKLEWSTSDVLELFSI